MGFVSERLSSQLRAIELNFQLDADHYDLTHTYAILFGKEEKPIDIDEESHAKPIRELWECLQSQVLTPGLSKKAMDGDLAEDHLPSLALVGKQLDDISKCLYGSSSGLAVKSSTNVESARYPLAELAFLAKIAAVLNAYLLHRLLAASTTLTPDIAYWRDQEISSTKAAYYLLQTLPGRLYHYSRILFTYIRAQQPSHLRPHFRMFSDKLSRRLKQNLMKSSRLPSATGLLGLTRARLQATPTVFDLAKQEIRVSREKLEVVRQTQAGCLGLLVVDASDLPWNQASRRSVRSVDHTGDAELVATAENVQSALSQSLALMAGVMERVRKAETDLTPEEDAACTDFSDLEVTPQPIPLLYQQAKDIYSSLQLLEPSFHQLMSRHGRPSALARYWAPVAALTLTAYKVGSTVAVRWDDVQDWANNFKETVLSFFSEWILKPLENIYVTVRHKEARLSLSSGDSLTADLESLERMVVDYAKDQGITSAAEIRIIAEQAQKGDLSVVLKRYAEEIKSPLKNAVSGDLIRALLIQIQKAKVDGELAIDALDKLLRSNELNFAFLAVTPSLLVSWLLGKKMGSLFSSGKEKSKAKTYEYIRASIRNIDRILNQANRGPGQKSTLTYKAHGLLLCEVYLLRKCVPAVTRRESYRQRFIEDLRELESGFHVDEAKGSRRVDSTGESWTVAQRVATVQRMYRTYPFVRGTM
ncbi:hypothetical protein PhCBS80983_g03581 [Powellomyces hirtus]|uniref:NCA2-domain-containing protein n=1 Tax=Powellomyces hirtus TaxID=109895 RepID=A0A507E1R4_9FUNG|nr:hypothetical protein PhCBS80983_g03581 [Powellomyces hirtus]